MPGGLLEHLGAVAREKREAADIMLGEVTATLRHDTSIKKTDGALSRFERGETTPHHLDAVIDAYAKETGVPAFDYWTAALKMWREEEG